MSALYIIACSTEKNPTGFSPYKGRQHAAIEVEFFEARYACGDELAWLSAEHGYFAPSEAKDRAYNRKLDGKRAAELAGCAAQHAKLQYLLEGHDTVVLYGSALYRDTVKSMLPSDIEVVELVGADRGCGDHFSALQRHLEDPGF